MKQALGAPAPVLTDEPQWLKGNGAVRGHATATILRPAKELYYAWCDIGSHPLWMERIIEVTENPDGTSHWVMDLSDPGDKAENRRVVAWDSAMVSDVPNEKLAWRSVDSAGSDNAAGSPGMDPRTATPEQLSGAGEVYFYDRGKERGTEVLYVQEMRLPGGKLHNALQGVLDRSPRQAIIENLRRFKALMECGEIPTTKGQPSGPRGLSGGIKEIMYGETNPEPPGTRLDPEAAWSEEPTRKRA